MNNKIENLKIAITNYFKGVRVEWGKITWPEKQQVVYETVFVVAIVFVFTMFIFLSDKIFELLLGALFGAR